MQADDLDPDSPTTRVRIEVPARVPLIGRLAELRTLHDSYRLVQDGGAEIVGVRGEAGIGKTRLVRAFVDDLRISKVPVYTTRCTERLAVPLLPIVRLVQRLGRDETIPVETRERSSNVIDQLLGKTVAEIPSQRAQLFMNLAELLVAATSGRPTVIVVDDVQWADAVTSEFVEFFGTELLDDPTQTRTLLVLTERSSFDAKGPSARCCERLASWIELGPLDDGAQRMLLRSLGIERPSPQLVADLWSGTSGNTLHLIETVRQLAATDGFVERDGVIETQQALRTKVPADLSATVRQQISNLSPETVRILTGFAVLGDETSLDTLSRLFELTSEIVQEHLSPAVDAGIVERSETSVSFTHPLFRQVIEHDTPDSARAKLHNSAVHSILGGREAQQDSLALVLAPHIVAAGSALTLGHEQRTELLATAARQSFASAGWVEAHRYYLAALSSDSLDPNLRGWLQYEAGRSAELSFDWALARDHYQAASDQAEVVENPELGAWAAISQLHARTVAGQRPRFDDELETSAVESFIDRLGPEHGTAQVVVRTQFSQSLSSAGQLDKALRYATEARNLALRLGDKESLVKAEMTAGLAASFQLDISAAIEHYRNGQAIASRIGDDLRSGHGLTRIALLELMVGDLDGARLTADSGRSVNLVNKQWSDLALLAGIQAQICLLQGDFVGVESWSREGEYYIDLSDYPFAPGVLYPILATARALQGEHDAATRAIDGWSSRSGRRHQSSLRALERWSDRQSDSMAHSRWETGLALPNLARFLLAAEQTEEPGSASEMALLLSSLPDKSIMFAPGSATSVLRAHAHLLDVAGEQGVALDHARQMATQCGRIGATLEQSLALLDAARLAALDFKEQALADLTLSWRISERLGAKPLSAEAVSLARQLDPAYELHEGETSQSYRVVMFVDMVGSVAISVRSDQLYIDLVDQQFAIVRRRIAEFGGVEFGAAGDAVLAWFSSVSDALRCGVGIQTDVRLSPQPRTEARLAVKIGIAAGKLLERGGNLYGRVVNLAARLSDEASGGHTVVTQDLEADVPSGFRTESLGSRKLKGFDTALRLVSVDGPLDRHQDDTMETGPEGETVARSDQ